MICSSSRVQSALALVIALALVSAPTYARPRRHKPVVKPTGVVIYSLTDGASILIDDREVGKVPVEDLIPLTAGKHIVRLRKRGYAERTEVVKLRTGQQVELEMDLVPSAGVVRVVGNAPGAALWLDGRPFAKLPFDGEIPIGRHTLKCLAEGFLPQEKVVEIDGGKDYAFRFILKEAPVIVRPPPGEGSILGKWWFWTAAGVLVAGGVTAAILLGGSKAGSPGPTPDMVINL